MIKTVGELRDAMDDAPHDMPVRIMINKGVLLGVNDVEWLDGKCVIVTLRMGAFRNG
jgi:hypothetical protein